MDKIIFLDIDGVLNHQIAYMNKECKYKRIGSYHYQGFASESKRLLNSLIKVYSAKVVISSTWRLDGLEVMRNIWDNEEMEGEVVDITPCDLYFRSAERSFLSPPRGLEIKVWLGNQGFYHLNWDADEQRQIMEKSGIANYIIIDDDSDMLYEQRHHFVHTLPAPRNLDGYNQKYHIQAMEVLSKDIVKLNYRD